MGVDYLTRDRDTVDYICWRYYVQDVEPARVLPFDAVKQRINEAVTIVLEANPGVAARGAVLPAGIPIRLPDIPPPKPKQTVRIWG